METVDVPGTERLRRSGVSASTETPRCARYNPASAIDSFGHYETPTDRMTSASVLLLASRLGAEIIGVFVRPSRIKRHKRKPVFLRQVPSLRGVTASGSTHIAAPPMMAPEMKGEPHRGYASAV